MFQAGQPSHNRGKTITVDPIKSLDDLARVKALIANDPRLSALWALATNSALRASDLVRIRWSDITTDGIALLERKTGKRRVIPLNEPTRKALDVWREHCVFDHVFSGQRGQLTVGSWSRIVKDLCERAGLDGRFGSHSCRKAWVRIQLDEFGTSLSTLMYSLNHATERQTLAYAGKLTDNVTRAYANAL